MIFQNKDGHCFFFFCSTQGGCSHPSIQNVLLLAPLISLITTDQWEEIEVEIVETLLSHFLPFVVSLSPGSAFSEVSWKSRRSFGKRSYWQDSWINALTFASLITLPSNAKGYTHPSGFRPQCLTFMKALCPFLLCLPSFCAHVVWSALTQRTFGSRDILPAGSGWGIRVIVSWVEAVWSLGVRVRVRGRPGQNDKLLTSESESSNTGIKMFTRQNICSVGYYSSGFTILQTGVIYDQP